MAPNSLPLLPSDGWQQRLLPVLAELASEDDRIADLRVHGSASGEAATAGADPLLGGPDEDGADAARLQRRVDFQHPYRARAGGLGVIDPAKSHWQAPRRACR
jgi:hypothetical protein